jgi:hypothetical protein
LSGRKKIAGDPDRVDDIEDDYVPITDAAVKSVFDGKGKRLERHLIEQHRQAFIIRAFPEDITQKQFDKPQSKSASIELCRPKNEVGDIIFVVQNWKKGIEIRHMNSGDERDDLLRFRR